MRIYLNEQNGRMKGEQKRKQYFRRQYSNLILWYIIIIFLAPPPLPYQKKKKRIKRRNLLVSHIILPARSRINFLSIDISVVVYISKKLVREK